MTDNVTTTSGTTAVPDIVIFSVQTPGGDVTVDVTAADLVSNASPAAVPDLLVRTLQADALVEVASPDKTACREAERAFRRQRRLTAADEMERWLAAFGLTAGQWRAQIRRDVAIAQRSLADSGTPEPSPAPVLDLTDDLPAPWAALVCSGTIEELAGQRSRAMATVGISADQISEEAIDRAHRDRPLDWLAVSWTLITSPSADEDAGREAVRCLVDDDLPPKAVADLLGGMATEHRCWLHEAATDIQAILIETDVGHPAPPQITDDGLALIVVTERTAVPADDGRLRSAIRAHLTEVAKDNACDERITWHVHF